MELTKEFDRLPVGTNNAYKQSRTGRRFLSQEGKDWKDEVGYAFKGKWNLKADYGLEILIEMGDKRRRDIDGGVKFILDALENIVYENDSQVFELHIAKMQTQKHKTIISIYEIGTW